MSTTKGISKLGEEFFESLFPDKKYITIKCGKGSINNFLNVCVNEKISNLLKIMLTQYDEGNYPTGHGDYLIISSEMNEIFAVEIKTVEDFFKSSSANQARLTHNVPIILIDLETKALFFISRSQLFQLAACLDNGQHTVSLESIGLSFSKFRELFGDMKQIRPTNKIIYSYLKEDFKDHDTCQKLINGLLYFVNKGNSWYRKNTIKEFGIPQKYSNSIEVTQRKQLIVRPKSITKKLSVSSIPQSFDHNLLKDFKTRLNNIKKITDDCLNSMPSAYNYSKGS